MPDAGAEHLRRRAVFTIPTNRSFADSLVAGLLAIHGRDPLALASGRILLPNNRAVRSVTDAFVRASRSGLVLPRLIPIGDPELEERIGGALDPADFEEPVPPAAEPLQRLLALAELVRGDDGETAVESLRLAADLARTLDALLIEEIEPGKLQEAAADAPELAVHWQVSLDRLRAVLNSWPERLKDFGRIDLAQRRNLLLHRLAIRWIAQPPAGFTIAAGITTSAPAVAALLARIAAMPDGAVVLPGLALASVVPDEEWDALGPDENGRGEETHPQFHLKQLLDRMGVAREEVRLWPRVGLAASTPERARAVSNAFVSAQFSDKWSALRPRERRLTGIRTAVLPDSASEAQAIALAIREALETPARTVALVTPDRSLARRVSALLSRWGVEADDSAGKSLSELAPGTLLLGIASAMAEELAPVPLLALLKHPLVGGVDDERVRWLDDVRLLDLALRGPRPAAGLAGLDRHFADKDKERGSRGCLLAWRRIRPVVEPLAEFTAPASIDEFVLKLVAATEKLAQDRCWRGQDGRMAAELLAELQASDQVGRLTAGPDEAVALLGELLASRSIRPSYGGHPRVFIWGLLEARLQQADLMILGGLNEGVWPAFPAPDPWLAPKIRANLGLPGLEYRIGLSAHDFASALGAGQVLITRAKREGRSPTVASRFWLRLDAISGGLPRDTRLERITAALDDPGPPKPVAQPQPCPRPQQRPKDIWVTQVDRLKADPFAFYAQAILKLRRLDPVDADHTAAWKGTAVHGVFESWLREDQCDPDKLRPRAEALLADEAIHPMLRALWAPRLLEAIDWMAELERDNRKKGRRPLVAEATGEAPLAGVTVHGRADRIDRLGGDGIAIVDYKTGKPPTKKAIEAGFALQLGLLGLIARAGGFEGVRGDPEGFEYWSLIRDRDSFGKCVCADKDMGADEFLAHAHRNFAEAAEKWLTGTEPFKAKLNPAYAPYGDYDQLMRLEEWYGRK